MKINDAQIQRPILFFTPERLAQLRQRIKDERTVKDAWSKLLQRADNLLKAEFVSEEYAEAGKGQHGNYGAPGGQVQNIGSTLGLAYLMTDEKRYAEKLKETLLFYSGYKRWCGIDFTRWDPPWHSELNTARFCYGYAIGYDCIYDFLPPKDRRKIADAIISLGILPTLDDWVLPEKRIHALDSMGHNWWSVCVAMAGLASLSLLGDDPRMEDWINQILQAFSEWFYYKGNVLQNKSINFDENGAFYESVGYANYALSEYLVFRLACLNVFPDSPLLNIPLLEKTGNFFLHTCYPASNSILSANFGDSSINTSSARTIRLLIANGYEKDEYRWYLKRTDPGLNDPIGLVYYHEDLAKSSKPKMPKSAIYSDIGWATMRSSWDDNATMLAIKSGFTWNHAHADAGSFILFHNGKPIIIDSGACSYDRPEYGNYYCQSRAHNVILFNGEGQNTDDHYLGVKTCGQVYELIDTKDFKYVYADATGPMSKHFSRNYRHFLWIDDVILILDDIRTHKAGKLEWLLHYEGEANKQGTDIHITNDQAKVIVRPLFPDTLGEANRNSRMQLAEKEGLRDHEPDSKVKYLAISPHEAAQQMKFLTAIFLSAESDIPNLERLQDAEMIGARISNGENVTDVYMNLRADGRRMHRNSYNIINGWETDAYLLAITRPSDSDDEPEQVTRYFVACGSYLRKNGKVIMNSLSKVSKVF